MVKDLSDFSGIQKASVVMMSLEEDVAAKVFSLMTEDEIRNISRAMSSLGSIDSSTTNQLISEFSSKLSSGRDIIGNSENTQKILARALGEENASAVMGNLNGPQGVDTWDKLNSLNEEILASFLRNEYPQTAALVLSKIRSSQAARVLSIMPDDLSMDIIQRMLTIEPVKDEILQEIERTLQQEFMSNLSSGEEVDSFEMMAEVFNNFDRNTETKFFDLLEASDNESAEKIRELMFTFDDLIKVDNAGIQRLISKADKDKLVIALKGANDGLRELFFNNMSERAVKIMKEDMESAGPVRIKDVDEAQMSVVTTAKELVDAGEIVLQDDSSDEELIY